MSPNVKTNKPYGYNADQAQYEPNLQNTIASKALTNFGRPSILNYKELKKKGLEGLLGADVSKSTGLQGSSDRYKNGNNYIDMMMEQKHY